jgi:hypothetical protein
MLHLAYVRVVGTALFCISYSVFAIGRVPGTRIDRTAMAIIGASLMVLLGVLGRDRPSALSISPRWCCFSA